MNPNELKRVNQFCKENPAFTEPSLRWLIHKAKDNGLAEAKAIVRIGGSVYLHVPRFSEWLEERSA